jgi:hypothetical protein
MVAVGRRLAAWVGLASWLVAVGAALMEEEGEDGQMLTGNARMQLF